MGHIWSLVPLCQAGGRVIMQQLTGAGTPLVQLLAFLSLRSPPRIVLSLQYIKPGPANCAARACMVRDGPLPREPAALWNWKSHRAVNQEQSAISSNMQQVVLPATRLPRFVAQMFLVRVAVRGFGACAMSEACPKMHAQGPTRYEMGRLCLEMGQIVLVSMVRRDRTRYGPPGPPWLSKFESLCFWEFKAESRGKPEFRKTGSVAYLATQRHIYVVKLVQQA